MRIALYGGSFNPIHHGHLIIARSVAEQLQLDRVIFLPTANPPHKTANHLAPAADRAEMVRQAIAGEPLFELSNFDMTRSGPTYTIQTVAHFLKTSNKTPLPLGGESLGEGVLLQPPKDVDDMRNSVQPLDNSQSPLPQRNDSASPNAPHQLSWIIGADSLKELPTWHRVTELVDMCQIITAARPGYDVIDWHLLAVTFNPAQIERLRAGVLSTPRIDISSTDIRQRVRNGKSIRYLVPESVLEFIAKKKLYC